MKDGGGSGIRTHDTVSRTAVFKTAAINRSAIPPVDLSISPPAGAGLPVARVPVSGAHRVLPGAATCRQDVTKDHDFSQERTHRSSLQGTRVDGPAALDFGIG